MAGLVVLRSAEANILCKWFGRCLYESPGFRITVVDKETGQPLADVHGLAEWQNYAMWGRNGPLMVQDDMSGPDGLLAFPAWGPIHGYRDGLILNHDPVVSLFEPGYRTLMITNAYPEGTEETTRFRPFGQDGQTFALEPFRGNPGQWVEELKQAAFARAAPISDEQRLQFRGPYLNRLRRVWAERDKAPEPYRSERGVFWVVEGLMRFLEEGHR